MSRAGWRNAILAAAVAALGLFVYLKPATDATAERALSAVKPEAARAVRLAHSGAAPIALKKRGEEWFLTSPVAARADPLQVQRLLAIAGRSPPYSSAATDLARFGLDRPATQLTIDEQRFDFGIVNDISREQYVLTGGQVHAVSPRYGAALPTGAGELISKQLLTPERDTDAHRIERIFVAQAEGKWVLKPPGEELSQDDLQGWVDAWRHASALRVEPHGKGTPSAEVKMRFRDGTALSLGILSREPEAALLRPDEKLVYYLSRGIAKRLLSPPGAGRGQHGCEEVDSLLVTRTLLGNIRTKGPAPL
jgi:hypothetical protein